MSEWWCSSRIDRGNYNLIEQDIFAYSVKKMTQHRVSKRFVWRAAPDPWICFIGHTSSLHDYQSSDAYLLLF